MARNKVIFKGSGTANPSFESTGVDGLFGRVYADGVFESTSVTATEVTENTNLVELSGLPNVPGVAYTITYVALSGLAFGLEYPEENEGIRTKVRVIPDRRTAQTLVSLNVLLLKNGTDSGEVLTITEGVAGDGDWIIGNFPETAPGPTEVWNLSYTTEFFNDSFSWVLENAVLLTAPTAPRGIVAVFDSVLPVVSSMLCDDSVSFTIPESRLETTSIGGVLTLEIEGAYGLGEQSITVINASSDGLGGLVPEGAIATIDGNSYAVDRGTRVSVGKLKLKITTGLIVALVGGEPVGFATKDITVSSVVSMSIESFYVFHSEGEAAFGFQFARADITVLPIVGWFCQKSLDKGHVIFVDKLPNVVVVWVGKVTS